MTGYDLPIKTVVEGLLFVAEEPLSAERIQDAIGEDISLERIEGIINQLINEYDEIGRAFVLRPVAGGFQFRTRPEISIFALRLKKDSLSWLSRATQETLAVIAYHQPVTKMEIEKIRGFNSGRTLKALMRKGLVHVVGRMDDMPGRPKIYSTLAAPTEEKSSQAIGSEPDYYKGHAEDKKGEFDRRLARAGLAIIDEALESCRNNHVDGAKSLGLADHRFRYLRQKFQKILAEN